MENNKGLVCVCDCFFSSIILCPGVVLMCKVVSQHHSCNGDLIFLSTSTFPPGVKPLPSGSAPSLLIPLVFFSFFFLMDYSTAPHIHSAACISPLLSSCSQCAAVVGSE